MQIILNDSEIKKALVAYVSTQGISIANADVDVTLTAGRGPNGMSATIDISPSETGSNVATVKVSRVVPDPDAPTTDGSTINTPKIAETIEVPAKDENKLFG
jgi:hypothetical protein